MTAAAPEKAPVDPIRAASYDPAFRPAIADGCLTVRQALQRGRRDQWAATLAMRHGLTLALALQVTDNRLSLGQAMRRQRSPEGTPAESRARTRTMGIAWIGFGVPLMLFLVGTGWYFASNPAPAAPSGAEAVIVTDTMGRVIRVEAADPLSVLEAYCASASSDAACEPVGLMRNAATVASLRVGILVEPDAAERLLSIPIRRQRGTRRWRAGDGKSPITPLPAPHNAMASLEADPAEDLTPTR